MDAIDHATEIVKKLKHAGHTAYFAGGWVRDHLMRHPSNDIDIATDASPDKVLALFPNTILVGVAFGVIIVSVGGHQFEVATFRKDFGYTDGRKPDKIEFTDPEGDAMRRDFTINGMFYDPIEHVIHDFVQGAADLQRGVVRAIGNPYERFLEDRLRMIRAVRFASRFAFAIDPDTQEAIIANADLLFPAVAMERVWMEFNKMAEAPRFDHALVELHRLGLLPVIFPRLQGVHLNEIKRRTAPFSRFPAGTPTAVYIGELFPDASVQELTDIFQTLHVSNQDLKLIEAMAEARETLKDGYHAERVTWARFYAHKHTSLLIEIETARRPEGDRDAFMLHHSLAQESLHEHIKRMIDRKPLVNADRLMAAGIKPGTTMGALLKEAERVAVNEDIHDPGVIISKLQQSGLWPA